MLVLVLVLVLKYTYEYHFGFDQQEWLATGELLRTDKEDKGVLATDNARESMAADLMAHHLKPGMTRAQVLALLGPPEREGIEWRVPAGIPLPDSLDWSRMSSEAIVRQGTEGFNQRHTQHAQPDTVMRYQVGWDIIDPTSMRVEFNGKGKVKKAWVGI